MGIAGTSREAHAGAEPTTSSSKSQTLGEPSAPPTRRAVLRGALAGVAVPLLAACGGESSTSGSDTSAPAGSDTSTPAGPGSSSSGGKPSASPPEESGGTSAALATTGQVPEGGGVILADDGVVITQPSAGMFNAFSSTCTHAGCTLDNVTDTINCICHGSQFSIKDGSVVTGPATSPLPNKPLIVTGSKIFLG